MLFLLNVKNKITSLQKFNQEETLTAIISGNAKKKIPWKELEVKFRNAKSRER